MAAACAYQSDKVCTQKLNVLHLAAHDDLRAVINEPFQARSDQRRMAMDWDDMKVLGNHMYTESFRNRAPALPYTRNRAWPSTHSFSTVPM